jgi:hypothetical protein
VLSRDIIRDSNNDDDNNNNSIDLNLKKSIPTAISLDFFGKDIKFT